MLIRTRTPMTVAERKRKSRANGKGQQRGGLTKEGLAKGKNYAAKLIEAMAAIEVCQPLTREQMAIFSARTVPILFHPDTVTQAEKYSIEPPAHTPLSA